MEHTAVVMDVNIIGPGAESALRFLDEWNSPLPYIVAHTSGSTGAPKPIRLLKSDMMVSARKTCRFFGIDNHSILGLPLSPDYIAGKMMIVRAIASGASLWCGIPSRNPLNGFEINGKIDLLSVVPSQIESLLQSDKAIKFSTLLIGGSPLSPEQESHLIGNNIVAYCSYGMTETCSHVALRRIGCLTYTAIDGITFSTDQRGCLIISCNDLSFKHITTNDIVRLIDPEHFEWLGRADNVINSGGIKLHPEMIERKLMPVIKDHAFYITSRPSIDWDRELVLIIESAEPIEELQDSINEVLSKYERPKSIIFQPTIPRTSSGKLIRHVF